MHETRELLEIYRKIQTRKTQLIGPDGEPRELPDSLYLFLVELLDGIGKGDMVTILRDHTASGTIQASEVLGISRRFLVGLLENGQIPFHYVGTHRRIYARDLFRCKAQRDANRSKAIRDLARAERDDGIYDGIPNLEDEIVGGAHVIVTDDI
jgi:excisionase family DNA binding protein